MSLSAAKSRVMQARSELESGRLGDVERTIATGERFLDGLPDAETAALRAEFAALRVELARQPTEEETRYLSAAKNTIRSIRSRISDRQVLGVEPQLDKAAQYLADVRPEHRAAVAADLEVVRGELAAAIERENPKPKPAPAPVAVPAPSPSPAPPAAPAPVAAVSAPTEEETRYLSAAKNTIRSIRSRIADRQVIGVESQVDKAVQYLADVRPEHRGEVAADLEVVRGELAVAIERENPKPKPAPVMSAPVVSPSTAAQSPVSSMPATASSPPSPAGGPAPLTDDERSRISRARSRLTFAMDDVGTGRTDRVDGKLEEVLGLLADIAPEHTQEVRAQIDEIRKALDQRIQGDKSRNVESELDRHLSDAKNGVDTRRWHDTRRALKYVDERLGQEDCAILTPEKVAAYRKRMADIQVHLDATVKGDALDRASQPLADAEEMLETNPFEGLEQFEAYRKTSDIHSLRQRVVASIDKVPATDPEIAAIVKRVIAIDQKVEAYSAAWGKARLDATVSNNWSSIERDIAGWESEVAPEEKGNFYDPELPITRTAIQRTRYLLDDEDTKQLRAEHPDDPAIQGPFQAAERVFHDAAAKLAAAYHHVLDEADKIETPLSQFVLVRPSLLAYSAESALAGTQYEEEVPGRARKLDERWKAEVAAIYSARQDLFDKLAKETEVSWPPMRDALQPQTFDPHDARPGMTVRFDQVYNRAGWDYGSRKYDFAMSYDGVVFGGVFAPEVLDALKHAWYELKLEVNDRFRWDIVGVIEGVDKIGKRTQVTLRDALTGREMGKLEEWPPIDCLRIRIIGLHAGPVAVTAPLR